MYRILLIASLVAATITCRASSEAPADASVQSPSNLRPEMVDSLLTEAQIWMSDENTIPRALIDIEKAYSIARSIQYEKGIMRSCQELGNYYLSVSDNANSTMYFYLMLKEAEEAADSLLIADANIGLGLVMYNMSKWRDAQDYLDKAEKVLRRQGVLSKPFKLTIYLEGLCLLKLNRFEQAKEKLLLAQQYAIEDHKDSRIYETSLALNRIALENKVGPEEFAEFDRILRYFEKMQEPIGICYALQGKAIAHLKLGQGDSAYYYSQKAYTISKGLHLIYPVSEVLLTLVAAEEMRSNYKEAYRYQIELNRLKDSTNSIEVATQIAMLGASHQFEKKEAAYDAEIKENAKQRRFFLFLFIATLFVVVIIVFMLRLVAIQRRKSDRLLRNILPKQTIVELQDLGHSVPKAHKDVTIVFADVVSFTKIASTLTPNILVEMLDKYFVQFDHIIKKYHLEKIKTIGDAYMFVSGLIPKEDSVDQAAAGCLEMIEAVDKMSDEMQEEFGIHFQFRFGMHTGNVVSGVVGDIKYAFDIWGDAVNIAARMEEHSETGRINISKESMLLLNDKYDCSPRGIFDIKNRGEVEMFYLKAKHKV